MIGSHTHKAHDADFAKLMIHDIQQPPAILKAQ